MPLHPSLHLLGTGAALADADRTTTMLAFAGDSVVVVDCGGDVVQRMLASGIDIGRIALLVITHEHPDHVSGFPLFMEKIWLAGRQRPIPVRGPARALTVARTIFEAFDTSGWSGLPEIEWEAVDPVEGVVVWEDAEWRITSTPGTHSVPVIGIRVEHLPSGGTAVYSADTERSAAIERLAAGAGILVHESTGDFPGHASARDAAEVARAAAVDRLVLVHIPADLDPGDVQFAERIFPGLVTATDGAVFPLVRRGREP